MPFNSSSEDMIEPYGFPFNRPLGIPSGASPTVGDGDKSDSLILLSTTAVDAETSDYSLDPPGQPLFL
jgi:hypothetical protein